RLFAFIRGQIGVSMKPLLSLVFVAFAALAQPPQARIKIDTDRRIGDVDKLLFGNFAEHLGRMIYGGVYEEGSPLSDEDGYRKDVMTAVKKMASPSCAIPAATLRRATTGRTASAPRISALCVRRWLGTISRPTASEPTSFSSIANASRPNRTSA